MKAFRCGAGALVVTACLGVSSGMTTPLPTPPFAVGNVPPDAATAAVEAQVATVFTKRNLPALAKCTLGLVKNLVVANERGDASAPDRAYDAYRACVFTEGTTWAHYRDALLTTAGLPACLGSAGALDLLHGTLRNDFTLQMTGLFCDGDPTSFGPHVPSDAASYAHVTKVAQILFRFAGRAARCKIKYADRIAAAHGDATELGKAETSWNLCYLRTAHAAYHAIPRLYAVSSGPACLPEIDATSLLQESLANADIVDGAYCAP